MNWECLHYSITTGKIKPKYIQSVFINTASPLWTTVSKSINLTFACPGFSLVKFKVSRLRCYLLFGRQGVSYGVQYRSQTCEWPKIWITTKMQMCPGITLWAKAGFKKWHVNRLCFPNKKVVWNFLKTHTFLLQKLRDRDSNFFFWIDAMPTLKVS